MNAASASSRIVVEGREVPWSTLPELVRTLRASRGDAHATEIYGKRLSYRELDELSDCLATSLWTLGLRKGDRLASLLFNAAEVALIWFGAAKLGVVWSPLNVGLIGQDLAYAIGDSKPRLILVDVENASKLDHPGVAPLLPTLRYIVSAQDRDGFVRFERLLAKAGNPPNVTLAPSDPAIVIYSGGTTGMPKGVVLPHFACICGGLRTVEALALTADDRYFGIGQLFHVGGLFCALLGPLIAGAESTIERKFSVTHYWRRVRETGATIIDPIGVVLTLLCRQPESALDRDHRVRASLGVTAGTPDHVPAEFSKRFGIPLINLYSLSEAGGVMIVHNILGGPKPAAHGKAWGWAQVGIVDDAGQMLAPHTMGEIVLRPNYPFIFMLGYLNDPTRTLQAFANLWLHTGDLGYVDEDGYLYFRGRQAHWLRRRGENISAYEVEKTIATYPGVSEVAVVGAPSELGDEEVKAFIIPKAGAAIDPKEMCLWCAGQMAAFKVPRFVEIVEAFPRSAAKNEIERHKLKALPNSNAWDREAAMGRYLRRPQSVDANER
jgi:crotonobetaine/carnitine-CoA ligase